MIFLDSASTTKVCDEALDVFCKYSKELYYNPSAPYKLASDVKRDIQVAEENIIKFIGGVIGRDKIIFTGSATESNNMAIIGALNKKFKKVLFSIGEHSSIYNLANEVKNMGFDVDYINLDDKGKVNELDFINKMTPDVGLVAVMQVSNETGAINDIEKLVKICKKVNKDCWFHCDGVQALCKVDVNVSMLNVDSYTFSGHKVGAPKGIAGLYLKKSIKPYFLGGGQQYGIRSGTENVAGIMSLEKAIANCDVKNNLIHVKQLCEKAKEILKQNNKIIINSFEDNSPYVLSISFPNVNGATLVNMMFDEGVCLGTGSACATKKTGNNTLNAMGVKNNAILGSVRMSFSVDNTLNEVEFACNKLIEKYEILLKIAGKNK